MATRWPAGPVTTLGRNITVVSVFEVEPLEAITLESNLQDRPYPVFRGLFMRSAWCHTVWRKERNVLSKAKKLEFEQESRPGFDSFPARCERRINRAFYFDHGMKMSFPRLRPWRPSCQLRNPTVSSLSGFIARSQSSACWCYRAKAPVAMLCGSLICKCESKAAAEIIDRLSANGSSPNDRIDNVVVNAYGR